MVSTASVRRPTLKTDDGVLLDREHLQPWLGSQSKLSPGSPTEGSRFSLTFMKRWGGGVLQICFRQSRLQRKGASTLASRGPASQQCGRSVFAAHGKGELLEPRHLLRGAPVELGERLGHNLPCSYCSRRW